MGRAKRIVVGNRGDALARIHGARVCAALKEAHPHLELEERGESSAKRGDVRRGAAALLARLAKNEIDVAVTDARWLPLQLPAGIEIAAVLERTNPFDVLISGEDLILDEQPENTCIAAHDAVKRGQLLYYRNDLKLIEKEEDFDGLRALMAKGGISAFVFPAADVETLGKQEDVVEVFTTSICTPVAGQGAIALLARRERKDLLATLRSLGDPSSAAEVELERLFLERTAKDGRGPIGVLANVEEGGFELEAAIAAPDGTEKISGSIAGALGERARVVAKLAGELLAAGGEEIIASFRKSRGGA